jgi:hypothetical protein
MDPGEMRLLSLARWRSGFNLSMVSFHRSSVSPRPCMIDVAEGCHGGAAAQLRKLAALLRLPIQNWWLCATASARGAPS